MTTLLHEVDGIKEEDNELPRWWLGTFFIAILFGYGYWEWFHVLRGGLHPAEEYAQQKEAMSPQGGGEVDEASLVAASQGSTAASGRDLFTTNCVACHGSRGEGKIGPNLTDSFWLHGDTPAAIHRSIALGHPLRGMPAWKPMLGTEKTVQVTAYVLTLVNTQVPGKPPEGTGPPRVESGVTTRTAP